MERDFEQEFKELKQSEIPDLWNRIEAGLSEKKAEPFEPQMLPRRFAWRKWGTLAAACLCVVIIFPAFSMLIRNKGLSESDMSASTDSGATACDTAAAEEYVMTTEATADDAAAEMYGGVSEEAEGIAEEPAAGQENGMTDSDMAADAGEVNASSPVNESAGAPTDGSSASADTAEEAAADKQVESAQEAETERADATEKKKEKALLDELSDGQILEDAVIRVQKADMNDDGTIYQASVVQTDAEGLLDIEMQIELVCDADTTYDFPGGLRDQEKLKEQETYRVDLSYDEEEGRFVVLTASTKQ